MPELPEVETTMRGIEPYLVNARVDAVTVRQRQLRWPIPKNIRNLLEGETIISLERRGKYILVNTTAGTAIWHLGMSGTLRLVQPSKKPEKHDHVDWRLSSGHTLRYTDPRRFGSLHWTKRDPLTHKLLNSLGVEPLSDAFNAEHLYSLSRGRKVAVKNFIMNSQVVVGVGNIYANEALFDAAIDPRRPAGKVSLVRYQRLVTAIKEVLQLAIKQGGTTLKDFVGGDGKPGYFFQQLKVYGRGGEACVTCGQQLKTVRLGQRASVFCKMCQN